MAAHIEAQRFTPTTRRPYFSALRWTAIFGGLAAGAASYVLLALLGVAAGLTAVDPQAAEPVGSVPMMTGIWTAISMLIAAFIGGYVAARGSGLTRRSDGMLHGFVTWGATVLLFAWLATSTLGTLLGGTAGILGQGLQGAASGVQQGGGMAQLEQMITGTQGGDVSQQDMQALQQRLQAGDRQGAISIMVERMGFSQERAEQAVDPALAVMGPGAGQQAEQVAESAVGAVSAASWWLFIGMLLSLALAVWGGMLGARAGSRRQPHEAERTTRGTPYHVPE